MTDVKRYNDTNKQRYESLKSKFPLNLVTKGGKKKIKNNKIMPKSNRMLYEYD